MRQDGLRIDSRKQRVHLAADLHMRDAALLEYLCEHVAPRAVHTVDSEFEIGAGDLLQIGKFADGVNVGRLEVGFFDFCRAAFGHGSGMDVIFNLLDDGRRGRAAIGGLELHSIPVPGIVAGGDHHSAGGAQVLHRVRESGRGCVIVGDFYRNSSGRKDFRRGLGKPARAKTRIIANHQAAGGVLILQNISSNGPGHAAHVLKGVIVGNNSAPAIGAKFDLVSSHLSS